MKKNNRLLFFVVLLFLALLLGLYLFSNLQVNQGIIVTIISVSILILLFSFVLEVYFTKPVEIIATSISIILLLFPQYNILMETQASLPNVLLLCYLIFCFIVSITAIISQILLDKNKPTNHWQNKTSSIVKDVLEFIANSKIMYFILGQNIFSGNKSVELFLL